MLEWVELKGEMGVLKKLQIECFEYPRILEVMQKRYNRWNFEGSNPENIWQEQAPRLEECLVQILSGYSGWIDIDRKSSSGFAIQLS